MNKKKIGIALVTLIVFIAVVSIIVYTLRPYYMVGDKTCDYVLKTPYSYGSIDNHNDTWLSNVCIVNVDKEGKISSTPYEIDLLNLNQGYTYYTHYTCSNKFQLEHMIINISKDNCNENFWFIGREDLLLSDGYSAFYYCPASFSNKFHNPEEEIEALNKLIDTNKLGDVCNKMI
jgi:uncharacterized CHY-type Zn-finger protein